MRAFTCDDNLVQVPYSSLYKIDFKKKKGMGILTISTNLFGCHVFRFNSPVMGNTILTRIRELAPQHPSNCFAFSFRYPEALPGVNGWTQFNIEKEFSRFFVSTSEWRLTKANAGYALCDTYPETLCVPCAITDEELATIAQFRSRGRLPVMTWRHPTNTATISRCAQPRVGLKGNRCDEDERLL